MTFVLNEVPETYLQNNIIVIFGEKKYLKIITVQHELQKLLFSQRKSKAHPVYSALSVTSHLSGPFSSHSLTYYGMEKNNQSPTFPMKHTL